MHRCLVNAGHPASFVVLAERNLEEEDLIRLKMKEKLRSDWTIERPPCCVAPRGSSLLRPYQPCVFEIQA